MDCGQYSLAMTTVPLRPVIAGSWGTRHRFTFTRVPSGISGIEIT
jgi:hypothetical protein